MAKGITGFKPERLCQVLNARELNKAQLSQLVNVSPATVTKWCNGQQNPTSDALEKLSVVMNVSQEWFTRPLVNSSTAILYRSNASAYISSRKRLEARMQWLEEMAMQLESYVDFPEINLPFLKIDNPKKITDRDIEDMAIKCREMWGVKTNPIKNLMSVVESAGAIIAREETSTDKIEGLSRWSEILNRPIILLSADKNNAFRSRFDLAHELGHIVLHKYIPKDICINNEIYKLMEYQAHYFAGALLLPEQFAIDLTPPLTLADLNIIKQKWRISIAAIIKRLSALEIIDSTTETNFFKQYSARGWRRKEPSDDMLVPESPVLLKRTLDLLHDSNILMKENVVSYFGLSSIDIEMLFGLVIGYFSHKRDNIIDITLKQNKKNNIQLTSSANNIIPFSS
ncbi:XRE family transcriptional regulator [Wohlfahrtiimonas chitiniclastica]|uniref:XRE family transcriptional regulator n=1 Tax=Wohlfahrtiimonas chitiniclastica TaxID=400946 RepID=UPI002157E830|nr:XRE family transcriptional regulator [Wohlfahrtiimonas chitiniclastica]MDC7252382.1 transcriptional regulator [Wohlfahrtiimonas chitiniclastica]